MKSTSAKTDILLKCFYCKEDNPLSAQYCHMCGHIIDLSAYEDGVLGRKILPIEMRIKVARETSKEEVMMLCAKASIASVVKALKQNPNLTPKVREAIYAKKEAEKKKLADEKARKEAERLEEEQKKERIKTAIWWIVGLAIAAGLIFLVVQYWETILAILFVIFVLFVIIK